jgi:hypothetical protein
VTIAPAAAVPASGWSSYAVLEGTFQNGSDELHPAALFRCPTCGELRGTIVSAGDGEEVTLSCTCLGSRCRFCFQARVRRPMSSFIDDTGALWQVDWRSTAFGCQPCQERVRAWTPRKRN